MSCMLRFAKHSSSGRMFKRYPITRLTLLPPWKPARFSTKGWGISGRGRIGSDSERTSAREPEVARARARVRGELRGRQSYRERETYLIWTNGKSRRGPHGKLRARACNRVCVPREKRWNFTKKLFVHDSAGNRNARSSARDEKKGR